MQKVWPRKYKFIPNDSKVSENIYWRKTFKKNPSLEMSLIPYPYLNILNLYFGETFLSFGVNFSKQISDTSSHRRGIHIKIWVILEKFPYSYSLEGLDTAFWPPCMQSCICVHINTLYIQINNLQMQSPLCLLYYSHYISV